MTRKRPETDRGPCECECCAEREKDDAIWVLLIVAMTVGPLLMAAFLLAAN